MCDNIQNFDQFVKIWMGKCPNLNLLQQQMNLTTMTGTNWNNHKRFQGNLLFPYEMYNNQPLSHRGINFILEQYKEVMFSLAISTFEILAIALRKKQLDQN